MRKSSWVEAEANEEACRDNAGPAIHYHQSVLPDQLHPATRSLERLSTASTRSLEDLGLGLPVGESQPQDADARAVTKKGWFQKRGQPPFTDFKTRFFVLQGSDVRYYASEDDYEEQAAPKGSFSCVGLRIVKGSVTAHSAQHGFHFVLYVHDTAASSQKKEIECACSTELERAEWLAALEKASHLGNVANSLQTASEDQLVPNEASSGFHFPHLPLPHLSFRHSDTGQRGTPQPSEAADNPIPHLHLKLDAAQVSGFM